MKSNTVEHNPIFSKTTSEFTFPAVLGPETAVLLIIGSEHKKPHFHISMNHVLFTGIRLDRPDYCFHEESQRFLSHEQREALIQFLKSDPYANRENNTIRKEKTVWEWLVFEWNVGVARIDGGHIDVQKIKMPNYSKLPVRKYDINASDNRQHIS